MNHEKVKIFRKNFYLQKKKQLKFVVEPYLKYFLKSCCCSSTSYNNKSMFMILYKIPKHCYFIFSKKYSISVELMFCFNHFSSREYKRRFLKFCLHISFYAKQHISRAVITNYTPESREEFSFV